MDAVLSGNGWKNAETKSEIKSATDQLLEESLPVKYAKKVLTDYYTKRSWCGRFWSGSWGRNHLKEVQTVLNNKHDSIDALLDSLRH